MNFDEFYPKINHFCTPCGDYIVTGVHEENWGYMYPSASKVTPRLIVTIKTGVPLERYAE